ncbi:ABC transporter permease [Nocardioides cavernaquae]|uniref:Transport permease protein n=1 Tax=Nocardioides cavernaquae TaxID=2321396 RepID=A0A3A5H6E0_9ACTN|nr:ABC transporter permease [Nocardioides cavernaquae]RJS46256.1 ABC transporter permease [Nocardioides cavernaquae]
MSLDLLAAEHGLTRVGGRPTLAAYLRELWRRRHFAIALGAARAYSRNQGSFLGQTWAILTPLLWAGVYLLVFGVMLGTDAGIGNYIGFLVIGVFLFHFTSANINNGSGAIVNNSGLVTSLQFPRALLPFSIVLAELFTLAPALLVLLVLVPLSGEAPQWSWLLLPFAIGLQWIFGTGAALLCARLVNDVRDLGQLIPFGIRGLMYASGVFYSIDRYAGDGVVGWLLTHQPIAVYLELGRATLLAEYDASLTLWLWGAAWAALALVVGLVYFWRGEARYGRG